MDIYSLTIAIPGNNFSLAFLQCFYQTLKAFPDVKVTMGYESIVYGVRDRLTGFVASKGKNQPTCFNTKYVLWIDSDCIWTPEDIKKLYKAAEEGEYPILSGWVKIAGNRFKYTPFFEVNDTWGTDKSFKSTGIRLCDDDIENLPEIFQTKICGGHFTLMSVDMLNKLPKPLYAPYMFSNYGIDNLYSGEDSSFCLRAYEHGYKSYVHTGVRVGHEKMTDISEISDMLEGRK